MKRVWVAILSVVSVAVLAVALSACASHGVSAENDLYGSFFTPDNARCLTLAEENKAVLELGDRATAFYAKYDLGGGTIELREGGRWGDTKYTLTIVSADELKLEFFGVTVDPDDPDNIVADKEATVLVFSR